MGNILGINDERTTLIRLTALWALNEAGLGGYLKKIVLKTSVRKTPGSR